MIGPHRSSQACRFDNDRNSPVNRPWPVTVVTDRNPKRRSQQKTAPLLDQKQGRVDSFRIEPIGLIGADQGDQFRIFWRSSRTFVTSNSPDLLTAWVALTPRSLAIVTVTDALALMP